MLTMKLGVNLGNGYLVGNLAATIDGDSEDGHAVAWLERLLKRDAVER
jgi:hypothetical protein